MSCCAPYAVFTTWYYSTVVTGNLGGRDVRHEHRLIARLLFDSSSCSTHEKLQYSSSIGRGSKGNNVAAAFSAYLSMSSNTYSRTCLLLLQRSILVSSLWNTNCHTIGIQLILYATYSQETTGVVNMALEEHRCAYKDALRHHIVFAAIYY